MAEQITVNTPYGETDALHWYLTDREVMWQALKELVDDHQHRGVVQEWPDVNGEPVWAIELNDYSGNQTAAVLGQHLVLTDKLTAYPTAIFESLIAVPEGE